MISCFLTFLMAKTRFALTTDSGIQLILGLVFCLKTGSKFAIPCPIGRSFTNPTQDGAKCDKNLKWMQIVARSSCILLLVRGSYKRKFEFYLKINKILGNNCKKKREHAEVIRLVVANKKKTKTKTKSCWLKRGSTGYDSEKNPNIWLGQIINY